MPYSLSRLAIWMIIALLPLIWLPQLPTAKYDPLILTVACLLLFSGCHVARELAVFSLLFLWGVLAARALTLQIDQLAGKIPDAIVTVVEVRPQSERMKLHLASVAGKSVLPPLYAWVSTQGISQQFCGGQRWRMGLTLRPVHARLNEGGFDAQRFALANRTPLSGRITTLSVLDNACSWRETIIQRSQRLYRELRWHSVLSALAFGDRKDLTPAVVRLLRETGTAHLMAISGMHISLAASVGWLLARGLQLGFRPHWIGYRLPLFFGLLIALIYCWLSGCNPPAIRATLALLLWCTLRLSGARAENWQVLGVCVGLILFYDPLYMLSESLWLSAMAVGGLLLWYRFFPLPAGLRCKRRWMVVRLLHLQAGLFLLLMPAQLLIFHGLSLSALLANLWAVPVVTLLTVPLILGALAMLPFPALSQPLWWLADRTLAGVFEPLSRLPAAWFDLNQSALLLCFLLLSGVMAWRFGWLHSSPATVSGLCLAMLCLRLNVDKPVWRLDMLDIGHGLAVVISRGGEAVVYDTGNRWPEGDAAQSQILPWLRWQGLTVKHIVISHDHLDHAGGLESLRTAFPGAAVHRATGENGELPCQQGTVWRWQLLTFTALWPPPGQPQGGNDSSCVLSVTDGKRRVLLTGDIEARAEREMVRRNRGALRAEILQVPHHGSTTSSSPPFLRAVRGNVALASAARYSAWKLPAAKVIGHYRINQYRWYDTALEGQLSIEFYLDNWQVKGLRAQIMSRWYHPWFGVPRDSR